MSENLQKSLNQSVLIAHTSYSSQNGIEFNFQKNETSFIKLYCLQVAVFAADVAREGRILLKTSNQWPRLILSPKILKKNLVAIKV